MARILHILDHSLPLHSGYSFRTRAIMKAQIASGLEVAGLTSIRHHASGGCSTPKAETVEGLFFHRTLDKIHGPSPWREWRDVVALEKRIEEVARDWRPDILHAHSPMLNGLAALRAGRRLGLPVLYEIRAFWEDAAVGNGDGREGSVKYRLTRIAETHVARRADAIAVICQGLKQDLVARGISGRKIMISPNGVDLNLFGDPPAPDTALASALGLAGQSVLGFIGSFYDYEGLDDLIDAMPIILRTRPDTKLLLVGGGPMEANLKARAAASPACDAIVFAGRIPHDKVEHYYSLIDILVYPRKAMRLTELVTPLKPLEAMAQNRLVAASNVGGHRELIANGDIGTLFAPDDPEAMARALSDLLGNRTGWALQRERARKFVAAERNWAQNIERYLTVYRNMLNDCHDSMEHFPHAA